MPADAAAEPDPFAGLVLDDAFVAAATRYEAPARTRDAIARFGAAEDERSPLLAKPRRARGRRARWAGSAGRPPRPPRGGWTRGRVILAAISLTLLVSTLVAFVRSEFDDVPRTTVPAAAPGPSAGPTGPAAGETADASDENFPELRRWTWESGHCYRWSQASGDTSVKDVPCAGPHLFEAVGRLDLSPAYPDDAPYPSEWNDIADRHCGPMVTTYLGYSLDPFGRYTASSIHPPRPEWGDGHREVVCGLAVKGEVDPARPWFLYTFSGGVRGADQAQTFPAGTCFREVADQQDDVVPCEGPHHFESVGTAVLPDSADGAPPSVERIDELTDAACSPRFAPYLDHGDSRGNGGVVVEVSWHRIHPESWRAGTRTATCLVGLVDGAGRPVETTGRLDPANPAAGAGTANV
ncbi:hypothetical protein CcI49_10220 [Frankia sp. CcI49]|uniref:septum formation family protein n=1 Tax=unclassified Frankia TaxID=2632575 RepID=UPI0006CA31F8|nr:MULTISPECIES: septum formation family protein [unclassified Frankia]KPM51091.1 hypothetical protein ACG83_37320 [Frankia sp. R43]ONH60670.1 hypothetical protein CcI49_10220 [Frankia sp. CcI49]